MFRNQYDTDVTVWSPEGRLLQVRRLMKMVIIKALLNNFKSNLMLSPSSAIASHVSY